MSAIPAWVVPGERVYAWLPPPSIENYSIARWETTIIDVFHGGSRREGPPSVTLAVPSVKYKGKHYYEHYPPQYDSEAPPETIKLNLFKGKGQRLTIEQLEIASESESGTDTQYLFINNTTCLMRSHTLILFP